MAADASEVPALDELQRRAEANGVPGLRRLAAEEIRDVEPHCGRGRLHVRRRRRRLRLVAAALAEDLRGLGGDVYTDAGVLTIADGGESARVETSRGTIEALGVVSCAGLQSDRLVEASGLDDEDRTAIIPFRGDYYALRPEARKALPCAHLPGARSSLPLPRRAREPPAGRRGLARPERRPGAGRDRYGKASFDACDTRGTLRSGSFWRLARRHWRTGIGEVYRDAVPRAFVGAARRYLPELSRKDVVPAPAASGRRRWMDGTLVDDFLARSKPACT